MEVRSHSQDNPFQKQLLFNFISEGLTVETHNINMSVARRYGFSPLSLVGSLMSGVWKMANLWS
jgi:hypothetical protein